MSPPRVVVVTRPTELELLIARHGTREQARFALRQLSQSIETYEHRQQRFDDVMTLVSQAIPSRWRRSRIARADLQSFVWDPADVVLAVGQDGLVANVAKYLAGQPVIGINPDPERFDGTLVRHAADRTGYLLARTAEGNAEIEERTLVEVSVDDGQHLKALNEIFIGHRAHQSASYRIRFDGREERQSSSGLIVATGTGSTGWARSIARDRHAQIALPRPADHTLAFFVREAFPSRATGTTLTEGIVSAEHQLEIVSELSEGGVAFGDGIEDDRLRLGFGARAVFRSARDRLRLVIA